MDERVELRIKFCKFFPADRLRPTNKAFPATLGGFGEVQRKSFL